MEAMEQAQRSYLPEENSRRSGLALCLSGGGFRAALFHLGALRRLNELGILSRVDTLSSVSGGSIVAAHLADRVRPWPAAGVPFAEWEAKVAAPLRQFTSRNLRTRPLLKRYLLPWNWPRPSTEVEALAASYEERLTRLRLGDLPPRPCFTFCATDMVFGVNWIFQRDQAGDYQAGYLKPAADWPLARAVAASSCFPPIFNPMPLRLAPEQLSGGRFPPGPERDQLLSKLSLTDGGVYDNMGLEPVWKTHALVLVSDGGATFRFEVDRNLFRRLERYIAIVDNQAGAVRKRWLISNFVAGLLQGTYWGVGSAAGHYGSQAPAGYSEALVQGFIARVRTDMDAFSEGEIAILENHGYLLAEAAVRAHVPALAPPDAPPLAVPHPQWMDEARARQALKRSHRQLLLGRF